MTTVLYLKIFSLLKSNTGNSSLPEKLRAGVGSFFSQKLCMSLSCTQSWAESCMQLSGLKLGLPERNWKGFGGAVDVTCSL